MAKPGYDPKRHHRRSIRLKGYEYDRVGAYFVTICTQDSELLFGEVVEQEMQLNSYGRVAVTMWQRIPQHFPHVELDEWIVMPNHLHGIIVIVETPMRRGEAFPVRDFDEEGTAPDKSPNNDSIRFGECLAPTIAPGSLGAIVGSFESVTTRRINARRKTPEAEVWRRTYYERIIRDKGELDRIRQYIRDNPVQWEMDGEYPNHP